MTASILAPLQGDFGAASALELAIVGAACGAVGVWAIQFGRAVLAESFTHALLPGLVVASLLGANLLVGALAGIAVAYVVLLAVQAAPNTSQTSATSVTVTSLLAAGALLASGSTSIGSFESLLFGDPLAAGAGDIALAGGAALLIAIVLLAFHERFSALALEGDAVRAIGLRPAQLTAVLVAVIVVAIAVAANLSGSLLALALLTAPAVGALALSERIGHAIAMAAAAGALSGIAGIYASYYFDRPASACIALITCGFAAACAAVRFAAPVRSGSRQTA